MSAESVDGPGEQSRTAGNPANHAATYFVGSLVAVLGGIIMLPVYTRALSPAEYGLLETVLRFVTVCMFVAFSGLRQGYMRLAFDNSSPDWRRLLTSTTIVGVVAVALGVILPLVAVGLTIARAFHLTDLPSTFSVILAIWLAFEAAYLIGLVFLQIGFNSRAFMLAQGGRVIGLLTINFITLHFLKMGLTGALLGNLATSVVSGAISAGLLLRWAGVRVSKATLRELIAFGLPYIPSAIFVYIVGNADRLTLLHFGIIGSLGLLSLASKMGEMALSLLASPIENVWMPYAFAVREDSDGPEKIGRLYTRYSAFSAIVAVAISLGAPLAIRVLATNRYADAAQFVPIVAIGCVFVNLSALADLGILIAKQTRLKPFIFASVAAVDVTLQVLLVPRAEVLGAVVATAIAGIFQFTLIHAVAGRFFRIQTRSRDMLGIVAGAGATYFVGRGLLGLMPSVVGNIVAIAIPLTAYVLLIDRLGIITRHDVGDFIRRFFRRTSAPAAAGAAGAAD